MNPAFFQLQWQEVTAKKDGIIGGESALPNITFFYLYAGPDGNNATQLSFWPCSFLPLLDTISGYLFGHGRPPLALSLSLSPSLPPSPSR